MIIKSCSNVKLICIFNIDRNNMNIIEVQNEIVEEFSLFEDWMQRYEYMIELGKSIELILSLIHI